MKTWLAIAGVVLATGCHGGDKAADKADDNAADKGRGDDKRNSMKLEANLTLDRMAKQSRRMFGDSGGFAVGQAGPTPATPCCQGANHKCAISKEWASSPVWSALEFHVDEPGRFQYSYAGEAQKFTATAVGDVDCDGHPTTYTVHGMVDGNGMPQIDRLL